MKRHILTTHGPRQYEGEADDVFKVREEAELKVFTQKWDGPKYGPMRKRFLQMGRYMRNV